MKKTSKRGKKGAATKRAIRKAPTKKSTKRNVAVKKAKKAAAPAARTRAASLVGALGCCTIKPPGEPDFSIPHITQDECQRRARAAGGVGHWRPGECAED